MKLSILIKENYGKLRDSSVRAWLFGLQLLLRRSLRVKIVSAPDPVIFTGNYFGLQWETTGCYKIVVNEALTLPGNITKIYMAAGSGSFTVNLHFFGRGEVIKKTYCVDPVVIASKKNMPVGLLAEWLKAPAIKKSAGHTTAAMFNKIDLPIMLFPDLNMAYFSGPVTRIIKEQHVLLEPFYPPTNNQLYPNP